MANYSDKQILEAIRGEQNRDVLKSLYISVLPNVERYIGKNSGSKEEAFDMFQDAIMVFFKQVRSNKFDENKYKVTAYLHAICKNMWINKVKRKSLENNWVKQQANDKEVEISIEENMISDERKNILEKLFESMGEDCKKLLHYSIYQDLSAREIAEKMGSNENSIRVQSFRCRKKLRDMVQANASLLNILGN